MNVQINEATKNEIAAVLDQNPDRERVIRIFVSGMQCSGPAYGLALDPATDNDSVYDCGSFKMVMAPELVEAYDEWIVDFMEGGFLVKPANAVSGCGTGCGGGCSCDC